MDSLSNHEKQLLKSRSDASIDVKEEIEKHVNKYKLGKGVITQMFPTFQIENEDLEKNIGRYIIYDMSKLDGKSIGNLAGSGTIFEIIHIQKHWGHVDGKYVSDKEGYRVAPVGDENSFGRVADVDEIIFVDMSEEEAINKNKELEKAGWPTK